MPTNNTNRLLSAAAAVALVIAAAVGAGALEAHIDANSVPMGGTTTQAPPASAVDVHCPEYGSRLGG